MIGADKDRPLAAGVGPEHKRPHKKKSFHPEVLWVHER